MPAVYAHALFGKKVYKCLEGECKDTVRKYKEYYILGLQGPDILFFYRPIYHNKVNKTGIRIHHESFDAFIREAEKVIEKYGIDSPEEAYVLGFICHYMLDSACHPFVLEEIERTGIDHISIESEFEKDLMFSDGRNPYTYDLRRLLPYNKSMAEHISRLYNGISVAETNEAIRFMRIGKYLLNYGNKIKARFILLFIKLFGVYKLVYPHMIYPDKGYEADYSSEQLKKLLEETINETSDILMEFYNMKENINPRFNRDFYGGT